MVRTRPAVIGDAAAIARIDVECWRASYAGLLPDKLLVGLSQSERRRSWTRDILRHRGETIVGLDRDGRVQGFGSCGAGRDGRLPFAGEVFTLYVAPDRQGEGLGRAILLALFSRLVATKRESALVWVLRGNPSRFFYERLGGRLAAQRRIGMAGTAVEAVAYGWPDLPALLRAQAGTGGPPADPAR